MVNKKNLTETEQAVLKVIESRWKLGRERYGEGIKHTHLDNTEAWVTEAIDESADLLQYLVSAREMLIKGSPKRTLKVIGKILYLDGKKISLSDASNILGINIEAL